MLVVACLAVWNVWFGYLDVLDWPVRISIIELCRAVRFWLVCDDVAALHIVCSFERVARNSVG